MKKNMEQEIDGDTKYYWHVHYSHQGNGTGTGRSGNKRMSGDHRNYIIGEIGQNTKKSPGDLRRFVVTQTLVENLPLTLV